MADCGPRKPGEGIVEYGDRLAACEDEESGAKGTWSLVEGADGKMYERNSTTGDSRLAPDQYQPKGQTFPVESQKRSGVGALLPQLAPLFNMLGEITGKPFLTKTVTEDLPGTDPRVAQSYGFDEGEFARVQALVDAGLMTASQAQKALGMSEYGGSGSGGGITAYQSAQMARQDEQDRVQMAMDNIALLGQAQARQDALAQQTQDNRLAALPYLAPAGQEYFSGFSPDAYGVKSGMLEPMKITRMAFDPAAGMQNTGYDDPIAKLMNQIGMIGR